MSKLYFKREDVLKVVEDAKKATLDQRRATFGQYLNGGAYGDEGLDTLEGGIERVNKSLKPELHLVHDRGIYLMPNAWFKGISIAYTQEAAIPRLTAMYREILCLCLSFSHLLRGFIGIRLANYSVGGFAGFGR